MADPNRAHPHSRPFTRRWWIAAAAIAGLGELAAWGAWGRGKEDPGRIRREAEDDIRAGRYDRAAVALARLRDPSPRDRLLKGEVALALGRPDEALEELARVPASDPSAPRARLLAGQIELRRGCVRRAEESLRAALQLDRTLVPAQRQLIYIYGMLLRRRELDEHFGALSRLVPMTFDNVFHWR